MKRATLCFLLKEQSVCLAMKKRGFGVGNWNGSGGKIGDKEGYEKESVTDATIREVREELGVTINKLVPRGEIYFEFLHNPEWDAIVYIFTSKNWVGNPTESDEMRPQWFNYADIPYDQMWDADRIWLPKVLSGKSVFARFVFNATNRVVRHSLRTK
ncbi:MAG: 8-oxo-dGTP diphosphatase [Patescibacteria group bacterium]|jgi:8-oxo-dGTP pyrophosphatase MutT (NUDIX family)